jgi:hypothetical protein
MRRVEIEREVSTRRWRVWVLDEVGGGLRAMTATGEWIELDRADPKDIPDPTWVIDDEVWIPLTGAILGLPTDQAPLADHLADARQVRDRLLTLVEQGWETK